MRTNFASLLLLGTSVAAITGAAPAWAVMATPASADVAPPSPAEASVTSIAEIVVTAERRAQPLLQVPASITAVSSATLESNGVATATELTRIVPGLNFVAFGSNASPSLRGVTSGGSSIGDTTNVAVYVDGIYQPFVQTTLGNLVGVQQVEVLKGPQGTYYGRNAMGGAIAVTTSSPSFVPMLRASVGYASFSQRTGTFYASGPLVADKLAINLAAYANRDDGYVKDRFRKTNEATDDSITLRAKMLFTPSKNFDALLAAEWFNNINSTLSSSNVWHGLSTTPAAAVRAGLPSPYIETDPRYIAHDFSSHIKNRSMSYQVQLQERLPGVTIKWNNGYRRTKSRIERDQDLIAGVRLAEFFQRPRDTDLQSDLTAASTGDGRLNWLVGATYWRQSTSTNTTPFAGSAATRYQVATQSLLDRYTVVSNAYAAFGEVSYEVTPKITFTGGLRYSYEKLHYFGNRVAFPSGATTLSVDARTSFDAITAQTSVKYALNENSNIYASFSQGFKAGIYTASSFSSTPVNPEKLNAYEVGYKTGLRKLSFTASAFYYDYKDLQVSTYITPTLLQTRNAATVEIYGAEVDSTWNPLPGLIVRGALALTHARYDAFPNAAGFSIGATQALAVNVDASGNRVIRSPDYQVNLSATYRHAAFMNGDLEWNVNGFWSDKFYFEPANNFGQPAYENIGASVAWISPGDRWKLTLYGRNLTDAVYLKTLQVSTTQVQASYDRPRVFGARLDYKY